MNKKQKAMFAHINGVQGRSPCKKKRCHPEERPQAAWRRRTSCRAHLQARRGTGTKRFDVNNRIIIVKRGCLHILKTKKHNHCVIL